jgi:hypothetical protein
MWVKVDDGFTGHPKVFSAGRTLGSRGTGRALAVWLEGICWSNRYATDGFLPTDVVQVFQHDADPVLVAAALVTARLWEVCDGGWRIHDFAKYQFTAAQRAALAEARIESGRRGGLATQAQAKAKDKANGAADALANAQGGALAKPQAKSTPVPDPDPFASNEAKQTRARELRAESVSGAQPRPPSGRAGWKPQHQPKTSGAFRCPHDPMCESYTACIDRALAEGKA